MQSNYTLVNLLKPRLRASLVQATPSTNQKFKRRAMERLASTKLIFTLSASHYVTGLLIM